MGRSKGKRPSTQKAAAAFVIDASIVMAWSFEDEASSYADAALDALQATFAIVPTLWPLEVANALLVGERRKRISQADCLKWVQLLGSLPITIDEETSLHAWTTTLGLARDHGLSVYDAAYLELAMRRGLSLATLDRRLKDAANAVGIALYGGG